MKYNNTFREALKQIELNIREDGHTDVASAVRQCKTAIEDASQMLSKLQGMSPEGDLPSWWMNKIAIAANSMNKLRDYLLVPSTNEQKEEPKDDEIRRTTDQCCSYLALTMTGCLAGRAMTPYCRAATMARAM